MAELDKELSQQKGYKEPEPKQVDKETYKSTTDIECGYVNQPNKKGLGYLAEMSVDTRNGIITGVDVFPANTMEHTIILNHIKTQILDFGLQINNLALDAGYDIGAVHRGLEILGITGYTSTKDYHNNPMKKGFAYDSRKDCFICRCNKALRFERIVYKKTNQNYYRIYQIKRKHCLNCPYLKDCAIDKGAIRINANAHYPSYYANKKRTETAEYHRLKRLRSIWSEGTFAVLKREHKLKRAIKRGLNQLSEECLLAAVALNLKRMVKAIDRIKSYLYHLLLNNHNISCPHQKSIKLAI